MRTYFDLLPQDLVNTILVYLQNEDVITLEKLCKIEYEILMMTKHLNEYRQIRDIMNFDVNMNIYNQSWKIIFININNIIFMLNPPFVHNINPYVYNIVFKYNSMLSDIVFSIMLKRDFPNLYHFKNMYDSSHFALILYICLYNCSKDPLLESFVSAGELNVKLTYKNLIEDNVIVGTESIIVLVYILHKSKNKNFIWNNMFPSWLSEILTEQDVFRDHAYVVLSPLYNDLLDLLFAFNKK
jgi:hypothetical protein